MQEVGDLLFDPKSRTLMRLANANHEHMRAVLGEHECTILMMLIEANGEIVSDDRIYERVWLGAGTHVKKEYNVAKQAAGLRQQFKRFGEEYEGYIERVRKVGYRLTVPVRDRTEDKKNEEPAKNVARKDSQLPPASGESSSLPLRSIRPSSGIDVAAEARTHTVIDAGLLGGFLGGAVVGLAYYIQNRMVGVIRIALVVGYGVFAGGIFGAGTQFGIPALVEFSKKSSLNLRKLWTRTVLVSIFIGIFLGIICSVFFWSRGLGPPVSWPLCVFGFLLAASVTAIGAIFREYERSSWNIFRAMGTCLTFSFVHFAFGALIVLVFQESLNSAFAIPSMGGPPFIAGCLIGALIGGLMGSQMCLTIVLFEYWQRWLASRWSGSRHLAKDDRRSREVDLD